MIAEAPIASPAEPTPPAARTRFPIGLAASAFIAFVVLVGLGGWQLERLKWKQNLLARIASLQTERPTPLAEVLSKPASVMAYRRVSVRCLDPEPGAPGVFRYALREGAVAWRLLTYCPAASPPYDGVVLDRGVVNSLTGAMSPREQVFAAPRTVSGVLRPAGDRPWFDSDAIERHGGVLQARVIDKRALARIAALQGGRRPVPFLLAVELERPAPPGLTPEGLPTDIPNNHFGYALTWFGLAGVLAVMALAAIRRRLVAA